MGERRSRRVMSAATVAVLFLYACQEATSTCGIEAATILVEPSGTLSLERLNFGTVVGATAEDVCGDPISTQIEWSSSDPNVASVIPITGGARPQAFVEAHQFGSATITARSEEATSNLLVQVTRPPTEASGFTVLGAGTADLATKDIWVSGDFAYTVSGPWSCGGDTPCEDFSSKLYVWSLAADGQIAAAGSITLPAPVANDVKVSADGSFAVVSQELEAQSNGILVLSLADPASPAVLSHYTTGLEGGVHNVWIEVINGVDYVFVVEDGSSADGGLHILDLTDRTAPAEVAHFYGGSSFVHDVYVRDGLAFVSHWDAGLVILDVGHGVAGGTPAMPVEVGRVVTLGGNTHNAWYWPARGLVFVGEERFPPPEQADDVGVVHVVDASNLAAPVEVAQFRVPQQTPHNFWVDETNSVLFVGWYQAGLRAIDVTGTLTGDLTTQGRERGFIIPSGERGAGSVWAPQLHRGLVYLSDVFNGIWAVRFDN